MVYGVYTMERHQIYLDREQRRELARLAEQEGASVSHVIREAVAAYIATKKRRPEADSEENPLLALIGMIDDPDAPMDGAVNHDKYIYGRDLA